MLERLASKLTVYLIEPRKHIFFVHVFQRLVFNIAIDVSASHVRVKIALEGNFKLEMLILFEKINHLWRLESGSNTF